MGLYHENYASMLLGALCNQCDLLWNPTYVLSRNDFAPESFHKIIFDAIVDLAQNGARELSEIEIDSYLKNYKARYETFVDSNGLEFISNIKELTTMASYEMYWNTIRKFSLLRDMKEQGFDITDYYDEAKSEESQCANLNKYTIQDILNALESRQTALRGKYDVTYVKDELVAGEGVRERLEAFEEVPAFGALLASPYLTTLYNGFARGNLGLRAGPSGSSKTRNSIADMCKIGLLEQWDDEAQDFVKNNNYQSPILFIATEQKLDEELEPMFWACCAGVENSDIINGRLTKEQKMRVEKAGEIIKRSGITLCSMPDFTMKHIDRRIKQSVEDGCYYVGFDYLEHQPDLATEYKNLNGNAGREDQVLKYATSELKRIAEGYNVGILFGMQLNDSWKVMSFVDESALAGSKACKNKLDWGSIIIPTNYCKKDMKIIEPYLKRKGFGDNREPTPNIVEFIFKSRRGIYGDQRLKIWSYFDKGKFIRKDLLITDDRNQIVKVNPTVLEGDF